MKPKGEIIMEVSEEFGQLPLGSYTLEEVCCEMMKRYASGALDEAAESARVERVPNGRPGGDVDYLVNKQSILKLKDKL